MLLDLVASPFLKNYDFYIGKSYMTLAHYHKDKKMLPPFLRKMISRLLIIIGLAEGSDF